jgi:transcriptional regulator with XRE-family HTH domain
MYESNEQKELSNYLSDPSIRHLYIDSNIRRLIAMQLIAMRESRGWLQGDVGERAGMKQSAIARLEDPSYNSMTISTLKRLAKAFDVALIVRFAPFSELISWITQVDESCFSPLSFDEELKNIASPVSVNFNSVDTRDTDAYPIPSTDISLPVMA